MSNHQDQGIDRLTIQLSTIQEQLSQLTKGFDKLEGNLAEASQLKARIAHLEDDLILSGDRYPYQDLQTDLTD